MMQPRVGRRELITMISSMMALTGVAIDLMLPAFDEIRESFDLGVGSTETSRIITVFFLGMAIGQLFYGPLADRFGRKNTLYGGVFFYVLGAVGAALAPTFGLMLASRFVWGIGAAGARVVAVAIIRDRFEGVAMAKAMSQIMAVFVLVPIAAPALGAAIIAVAPWRATFWLCGVIGMLIVVWSLRLRETLDPVNRRDLNPSAIAGGYWEVSRTPVTFGYTVATIFIQAVFTSYIASVDLLVSDIYDRDAQFPYIFGAVALLFGGGALINGRVVENLGITTVIRRALTVLMPLLALLAFMTIVADGRPNFWLFMPVMGLTLSMFMFLMPNLNAAAMEPVGHIAGSASALTGAVRIAGGALLGGFIAERVDGTVTPVVVGAVTMTLVAALCILLVWRRQGLMAAPTAGDQSPTGMPISPAPAPAPAPAPSTSTP